MSEDLFTDGCNSPGMLVTVDGPNGSGKTSLTAAIAAELRGSGASVHTTRQPSEGVVGRLARSAEANLRGRGLACLVAADRHQQVEGEVAEHLRAGEIVLCDRYVESSLVLQRLDGVEVEFILAINAGIPRPDLRIQLKADAAKIHERLDSRKPDPARRFERDAGGERELRLYEETDRLLAAKYGLGATVYDTSETTAEELGAQVAASIWSRWRVADD